MNPLRLAAVLIALSPAARAQGVASDADCRIYAEQAAFAVTMRDGGASREEVAPGLLQSGLGEGMVAVILDVVFDGQDLPASSASEAVYYQCSTGFR